MMNDEQLNPLYELADEMRDAEHKLAKAKERIRDLIFNNPIESVNNGLLSINWEAIRNNRFTRR